MKMLRTLPLVFAVLLTSYIFQASAQTLESISLEEFVGRIRYDIGNGQITTPRMGEIIYFSGVDIWAGGSLPCKDGIISPFLELVSPAYVFTTDGRTVKVRDGRLLLYLGSRTVLCEKEKETLRAYKEFFDTHASLDHKFRATARSFMWKVENSLSQNPTIDFTIRFELIP